MVAEPLKLEDVPQDDPYLNRTLTNHQTHLDAFHHCLSATETTIKGSVVTGKEYNKTVKLLSAALEEAAEVLPDHAVALDKFSSGLSRIETYREMLLTQTEVLTLEPLTEIRRELEDIKELSTKVRKVDELLSLQTERYCSIKAVLQDEHHTTVTYPKACIDTLRLREEHAYDKLEYVRRLNEAQRENQLKFVQKMLEQMLAQFSYANFAYVVMSEMEPYLSELFVQLQRRKKETEEEKEQDKTVYDTTKGNIAEYYEDQITAMKDTYPGAETEVNKNSGIKSLLSFAVPGNKGYLNSKKDSFLSYLNSELNNTPTRSPKEEEVASADSPMTSADSPMTSEAPKPRANPFNSPDLTDDLPIGEEGYEVVVPGEEADLTGGAGEEAEGEEEEGEGSVAEEDTSCLELTPPDNKGDVPPGPRKGKRRNKLVRANSLTKLRNQTKTSGYLYVRQKSALGHKWILMFCVIERDWLKCLVSDTELLELEHLPTTTVKPVGPEVDRNSCFYLISPKGRRCYQALTELDRRRWTLSLTQGSINALQRTNSTSQEELVARVHRVPGNGRCVDCSAPEPHWACIDHGTTICIDCSGGHRAMGVNVSKVRSLLLDNWTEALIKEMESKGNSRFNEIYEYKIQDKITPQSNRDERSSYLKRKYIDKEFHKDS